MLDFVLWAFVIVLGPVILGLVWKLMVAAADELGSFKM
jgi:hypothetical protein